MVGFHDSTIVSVHATADTAFSEIDRLSSQMIQIGAASDAVELLVVRTMTKRERAIFEGSGGPELQTQLLRTRRRWRECMISAGSSADENA
jgi:hypothetical protein